MANRASRSVKSPPPALHEHVRQRSRLRPHVRLKFATQRNEFSATRSRPPQERGQVINRPTAAAAKAVPPSFRVLVDVQARGPIVMEWTARLARATDGLPGQSLEVHPRPDRTTGSTVALRGGRGARSRVRS